MRVAITNNTLNDDKETGSMNGIKVSAMLHFACLYTLILLAITNANAVEADSAAVVITSNPPMQSMLNLAPGTKLILQARVTKDAQTLDCINPKWRLGKSLNKPIARGAEMDNNFIIQVGTDAGPNQVIVKCDNAKYQGRILISSRGSIDADTVSMHTTAPSLQDDYSPHKTPALYTGARALIIRSAAVAGVGIVAAIASSIDLNSAPRGESKCPSQNDLCGNATSLGRESSSN